VSSFVINFWFHADLFFATFQTVMLLATHPQIQDRVAAEIKEVFFSDAVEVNYDNLVKLEYLERVVKESLRLCPVVPGE
jgi:cytochrome P450